MNLVKISVVLFLFIIYSSIAYAAAFDIEITPIKDRIVINEFAEFEITIKNNLNEKDEYRIYTLDFPTWDLRTDPIQNPISFELEPGEEGSVNLVVDPLKIKDIGTYTVNANIRSKLTANPISNSLKVTILSIDTLIGGYVPTVVTGVDVPQKVDPREQLQIKISLNNQNVINYPGLVVKAESNLIQQTTTTKLGPKEDILLELQATLDPLTPPQHDNLEINVFRDDKSITNPIVRRIEIIEYVGKEIINEKKGLFLTKTDYNFKSNNNEYSGAFKVKTTLLSSILSSTTPNAKILNQDGKRYFVWEAQLVDNNMQVTVTKNFIPLFAVIALLILVVIAYTTLRSPLLMKKETSSLVKSEGGITEITVILHIKNRSKAKLNDIEITEFIPALVSIGKEVSIGSLQPSKILRHEKKKNTIVKWAIDSLDASEERVLSYKMKSQLSILGSFSLPAATASFNVNNKLGTSTSNRLSVEN
jgi:hypothetical protein